MPLNMAARELVSVSDQRGHFFLKTEKDTQRNHPPKGRDPQFPGHCSEPPRSLLRPWRAGPEEPAHLVTVVKGRHEDCPAGSWDEGWQDGNVDVPQA